MKSKFACLSDNIFCVMVIFIIVFVTIRKFVHNYIVIFALTLIITFVSSFLVIVFFDKKSTKQKEKQRLKDLADNCYKVLIFATRYQLLGVIKDCLKEYNGIIRYNSVWFETNGNSYILVPMIIIRKITTEDYIKIYNRYKKFGRKIVILSKEQDGDVINFVKSYDIDISFFKFENFFEKYLVTKSFDYVPLKTKSKKSLTDFLKVALNHNQSKRYFVIMIVLSAYSFLYRYNIYYAFFSLVAGILVIVSLKNKKFNMADNVELSF